MKLTAFVAALLLATSAMAQTAAPAAPETAAPAAPAAPAAAPAPAATPAPAPAPAPAAAPAAAAPAYKFAMKGFVSMTTGYQVGLFNSEGQLSNYSTTPDKTAGVSPKDIDSTTFDVRHSRFNFSVSGPQTMFGATPSGILEIDFMGGFGAGANGSASLLNRLRIAVAELNWGTTKLQFGQANDLIFAMAPTSLSHIGQPLGYATGNTGWRRPGIFGFHTLPVAPETKVELAWEIGRGNWNDTGTCVIGSAAQVKAAGITSCSGIGAGSVAASSGIALAEASAMPAFEGRATVAYGKMLTAFVGGHYHQVDLTGIGTTDPAGATSTTIQAALPHTIGVSSFNAGAKLVFDVKPVVLTLQGTGFVGKNAGPLVANFSAVRLGTAADPDVDSSGFWAQAGLGFGKWSLWAMYGAQKVDEKDFARTFVGNTFAASPYENATTNVLLMYRDGGWGFSGEWVNFATKYAKSVDAAAEKVLTSYTAKSDQYLLTANYFF